MADLSILFRGPGEGRLIHGPETILGPPTGPGTIVKVSEAETRTAYSITEGLAYPPGSPGPTPHIHEGAEEAWYVLEGSFQFNVGDREFIAEAGSYVLAPRGTRHTFKNAGDGPARCLVIFSPGRDILWQTMTEMRARAGEAPLDLRELNELRARYGEPPLPALQ